MGAGQLLQAETGKEGVTVYIEGGYKTSPQDIKPARIPACFRTPLIRKSYDALKPADVRMLMDYEQISPDSATLTIADPDGLPIEFAGKP